MKEAFKLTDEQAEAVTAIADAAAASWAKLSGRDAGEFYGQAFTAVTDKAPGGEGLKWLVQNNKAAVTIANDGKAVIHALEGADVSSAIHELGHVFHRQLELLAANGNQDASTDVQALADWTGEESTAWASWSRDSKEKVARGFERYLRDGKAPTAALRSVFAKMKKWLTSIYKTLKGSPVSIKITPEVRAVFDRLLGGEGKAEGTATEVAVDSEADLLAGLDSLLAESPADDELLFQDDQQVDSAEFKKWFGDSKVVDENGKPLVVYHGTVAADFSTFIRQISANQLDDLGFHFGTNYQAEARLENTAQRKAASAGRGLRTSVEGGDYLGARTMPLYLSLSNPLKLPDTGTWTIGSVASFLEISGDSVTSLTSSQKRHIKEMNRADQSTGDLRTYLESLGYDGVVYRNRHEGGGDSYIAFQSNQIKSAIGNRGTFDSNDPNILHQAAGAGNQKKLQVASAGLVMANTMAKAGTLTYEAWSQAFRAKLDSVNKALSARVQDADLLQMWGAMASGTLEHIGESQLDAATRKGMGLPQPAGPVSEPPAAPPSKTKSQASIEGAVRGIKNADMDELMASIGQPPPTHGQGRDFETSLNSARLVVLNDTDAPRRLVSELLGSARPITADEDALLTVELTRLTNARNEALADYEDATSRGDANAAATANVLADDLIVELQRAADASTLAGTENSLGLGHRRMMLRDDFTLANMERRAAKEAGRPLTDDQKAEIKTLHEELTEKDKQIGIRNAEIERLRREAAHARAHTEVINEQKSRGRIRPRVNKTVLEASRAKAGAAIERLRQAGLTTATSDSVLFQATEGHRKDVEEVGRFLWQRGLDKASWSKQLTAAVGPELAKQYGAEVWAGMQADIATKRSEAVKQAVEEAQEDGDADVLDAAIIAAARYLHREAVADGIRGRDAATDYVHKELQAILPDLTRRQAAVAMSGYGHQIFMSEDEISVAVRDQRGQLQQILKMEDMQAGKPPKASGLVRDQQSDEYRRLTKLVNEMKKKGGFNTRDEVKYVKSALASIKTRLRNRLSDLRAQIASRTKTAVERTPVPTDSEVESLRAEVKVAEKEFEAIFGKPGMTDAQRIAVAEKVLVKRIAELERQLATGDTSAKPRRKPISTPKLVALRARRDALQKKRDALIGRRLPTEAQRAAAAVKAIDKRIEELERIVRTGDKSLPARRAKVETPELKVKRAVRDALQQEVDLLRHPPRSAEEIALQSLKTRALNEIARLEQRRLAGNFEPSIKKVIREDAELKRLRADREKARRRYYEELRKYKLAQSGTLARAGHGVLEAIGMSRAIMTALDVSAVFRQGAFVTVGHPIMAVKATAKMFKAMRSESGRLAIEEEIHARPNASLYQQVGLITKRDSGLYAMEEAYMSRWIEKAANIDISGQSRKLLAPIKAGGQAIAASERAFSTYLNVIRANMFDAMVATLAHDGNAPTLHEAKAIAAMVNYATGRTPKNEWIDQAMVGATAVFFAPRLVASRFALLAGAPLLHGNASTRKLVVKEYLRFAAGAAIIYGLVKLMGGDWEDDPGSGELGRLRVGRARFDPFGGLLQTTTFVYRVSRGKTTTIAGATRDLRGDGRVGQQGIQDIMVRFLRNKLSPIVGTGWSLVTETDFKGDYFGPADVPGSLLTPMALDDMIDAARDLGIAPGVAAGIFSLFGISVATHDTPTQDAKQVNHRLSVVERDKAIAKANKELWTGDSAEFWRMRQASQQISSLMDRIQGRREYADQDISSEDKEVARGLMNRVSRVILDGKPLLDGLDIDSYDTARIVATDVYYQTAEAAKTGAEFDSASLLARLKARIRDQGMVPDKVLTDAKSTVRGAYTTQFNDALEAGDAKLATQIVKARRKLQVTQKEQYYEGLLPSIKDKQRKGELTAEEAAKTKALGKEAIYGR